MSFTDYLAGIENPATKKLANDLWAKVCAAFPDPPAPSQASSLEDGGYMIVWDAWKHHLDIEVYANGEIFWFYRNREIEKLAGNEDSTDELEDEFVGYLRLVKQGWKQG